MDFTFIQVRNGNFFTLGKYRGNNSWLKPFIQAKPGFFVLTVFCNDKILLRSCMNVCVKVGRIGNNIIIRSEIEKKLHEEEDCIKIKQEKPPY